MENSIKRKVLFNKPGGTAGKNSVMARVTLPTEYVKALGITQEEKEIIISLKNDEIIIKKA